MPDGELRVVSGGDTPVGVHLSTDDAPEATFVDEFDTAAFTQLVEYIHTGTVVFQAETVIGK